MNNINELIALYALGELEPEEISQVEQYLKENPNALAQIEKIRRTDGVLAQTFAVQPLPEYPAMTSTSLAHTTPGIERKSAFSKMRFSVLSAVVCLLIVVITAGLILPTLNRLRSTGVKENTVALNDQANYSVSAGEVSENESDHSQSAPAPQITLDSVTESVFPAENAIMAAEEVVGEAIVQPTEAPVLEDVPADFDVQSSVTPLTVIDVPQSESSPVPNVSEAPMVEVNMLEAIPSMVPNADTSLSKVESDFSEKNTVKSRVRISSSTRGTPKKSAMEFKSLEGKGFYSATPTDGNADYKVNVQKHTLQGLAHSEENTFCSPKEGNEFTFSQNVDTVSYTFMRSCVLSGKRPEPNSVCVEEYINYFNYQFPEPKESDACPITASCEVGAHPWLPNLYLAKIGLKVKSIEMTNACPLNSIVLHVDFNPETVKAYRLIGYENHNRVLSDSNSDKNDSSDRVSGDSVVMLYEIVPIGVDVPTPKIEDKSIVDKNNNVQQEGESVAEKKSDSTFNNELFLVKATYKLPESETLEYKVFPSPIPDATTLQTTEQSRDFRFAAAVALYAQLLRNSAYTGCSTMGTVKELLHGVTENDSLRTEFKTLVEKTPPK